MLFHHRIHPGEATVRITERFDVQEVKNILSPFSTLCILLLGNICTKDNHIWHPYIIHIGQPYIELCNFEPRQDFLNCCNLQGTSGRCTPVKSYSERGENYTFGRLFNRHQARWDLRTVGFTGAWQVAKVWGRVKQKFRCEPFYNQVISRWLSGDDRRKMKINMRYPTEMRDWSCQTQVNVVENESVTLAAVSRRREKWNDPGSRIGDDGSWIKETGSIRGLAVSLTPGGLETWIFFLASFCVVIR